MGRSSDLLGGMGGGVGDDDVLDAVAVEKVTQCLDRHGASWYGPIANLPLRMPARQKAATVICLGGGCYIGALAQGLISGRHG